MDDHDGDVSLWEMLGVSREDSLPPLEDDVWETVLHAALDPDAPESDDGIVPVHDAGHADAVGWADDADHLPGGGHEGDHHDLGGLLHDHGWDSHDLGSLEHDSEHHDLGHDPGHDHPDLGGFDHFGG